MFMFVLKAINSHRVIFKRCIIGLIGICLNFSSNSFAQSQLQLQPHQDVVIVIHGLGRTYRSMNKIQVNLEKEGYIVRNINYPSKKYPIETLVDTYIAPVVSEYSQNTTIHFVGHSLGGILTRVYLSKYLLPNLGKVVMLGTPNKGSEIVNKLRNYSFFRWYLGPAFLQLSTDLDSVPNLLTPPNYSVGIIAGTKSLNSIFSQFIKGENDGKVSVVSAQLKGYPLKKINVSHTLIMTNDDVIKNLVNFLKYGNFLKDKGVK
jgi:pimeloyl-ACP methyl ester carboxylesterase